MATNDLTAARARELFRYEPDTGHLFWKTSGPGRKTDRPAGHLHRGRRTLRVDTQLYLLHRIVWLHANGDWPTHVIDHINGDPSDNRLANLRAVTQAVNQQNQRRAHANNTSGYIGVFAATSSARWRACIAVDGKQRHLGTFDRPEDASAAYLEAKRRLHEGCTI